MNEPLNPLVAEYLRKKKQSDDELAASQSTANTQDMIGVGLKGVGALMSGNEDPVVYQKGWNEQGIPVLAESQGVNVDTKPLADMANRGRQQGADKYKRDMDSFGQEQDLQDLSSKRAREARGDQLNAVEDDPTSDASLLAQDMASKMVPGRDFSKLSATQLKQMLPTINKIYDNELRKREADASRYNRQAEQDERLQAKHDEKLEQKVTKLAGSTAPLQETMDAISSFESALPSKSLDKYDPKKDDLPGVNVPLLGRVSAYDSDARMLNSKMAKIFNVELKDRSGAAVTDPEMNRLREEFASGKFNSESEMVQAIKDYRQASINALQRAEQAYSPEVRAKYKEFGNRTADSLQGAPPPFPRTVRNPETGKKAQVSNEQELKAANLKGFQ